MSRDDSKRKKEDDEREADKEEVRSRMRSSRRLPGKAFYEPILDSNDLQVDIMTETT